MRIEVPIGNATRTIEIERRSAGLLVHLDADADLDVAEAGSNSYSILLGGKAFEAQVRPEGPGVSVRCAGREFHAIIIDPRAWKRGRGGLQEAEGRQQVNSPMPGRVVRVLVAAGDKVEARQGLIVVEAMKMQNEIRAPKSGMVEQVFVAEGQSVAGGDQLVIIA